MAAALRRISRGAQSFFLSRNGATLRSAIHTSVWWDLDDCKIPEGCDPSRVAGNITDAIAKLKYKGPVTISAYADMDVIDPKVEQALSDTGIKLTHVPYSGGKHAVGTEILYDLLKWSKAHPPPANCAFIFDDGDLAHALFLLQRKGYNILLGKPRNLHDGMERQAKTLWHSSSLLAGGQPESLRPGTQGAPSLFLFGIPRDVHTSVWWDLNNCKIPRGCDPSGVVGNITGVLAKFNYDGPVTISAYADMDLIHPEVKQALSDTGVKFTHVPFSGGKHAVGTEIFYDLLKWGKAHPPPGNCLFIFDDLDLAHGLMLLRRKGYTILLGKPGKVWDGLMDAQAKTFWHSSNLLAGRAPIWHGI